MQQHRQQQSLPRCVQEHAPLHQARRPLLQLLLSSSRACLLPVQLPSSDESRKISQRRSSSSSSLQRWRRLLAPRPPPAQQQHPRVQWAAQPIQPQPHHLLSPRHPPSVRELCQQCQQQQQAQRLLLLVGQRLNHQRQLNSQM